MVTKNVTRDKEFDEQPTVYSTQRWRSPRLRFSLDFNIHIFVSALNIYISTSSKIKIYHDVNIREPSETGQVTLIKPLLITFLGYTVYLQTTSRRVNMVRDRFYITVRLLKPIAYPLFNIDQMFEVG